MTSIPWQYAMTNTASTANFVYTVSQPSTVTVAPATQGPQAPLAWLRDQVDEVCRLAREP